MSSSQHLDPRLALLLDSLRHRVRRYVVWDSALAIAAVVLSAFWIGLALDYLDMAAIVTNPPYGVAGALAERFIARALELMMPRGGMVAMLLRYDFGAGHGPRRMALMWDNPHYSKKLILPFRPRWDDWWNGKPPDAPPRTNFAWYVWDARHAGPPIERMIGRASA